MLFGWKLHPETLEDFKDWTRYIRVATNPDDANVRKIKDKDGNVSLTFKYILALFNKLNPPYIFK